MVGVEFVVGVVLELEAVLELAQQLVPIHRIVDPTSLHHRLVVVDWVEEVAGWLEEKAIRSKMEETHSQEQFQVAEWSLGIDASFCS